MNPRPGPRPLRRPHRPRLLFGRIRQVRPGDRRLRRGLRRPEPRRLRRTPRRRQGRPSRNHHQYLRTERGTALGLAEVPTHCRLCARARSGGGAAQTSIPRSHPRRTTSPPVVGFSVDQHGLEQRQRGARVTGQLTNLEEEPDRELAQVIDQLSRRFPHLSERWLHEVARTVHERFRDAPVRTFVPLLIEHQVVGTIRRTSAAVSAAEGSLPPTPLHRRRREVGHSRDEASPEGPTEPGRHQRAGWQAQSSM